MRRFRSLILASLALLAACELAPRYERPTPAAPPRWPEGAAYAAPQPGAAGLTWRALIGDPKLRSVIEMALANSQDLRAAVANAASARAQYHVQRSQQLPALGASASAFITHGGHDSEEVLTNNYQLTAGLSNFEIDLFGRLRDQTRQSFEAYLATASGTRSTRVMIVAETATAYTTLAADLDHLAISQQTVASAQRSLDLTETLFRSGLTPAGNVESAATVLEQARSDAAAFTTGVAQDRNALERLVGAPVPDNLLPSGLAELDRSTAVAPTGISSAVLLDRPDVLEAEHQLKGANAGIGAARAAFFPAINLTAGPGLASTALSQLFTGGAFNWSVQPSVTAPLLGGSTQCNLQYAMAQRAYDLALYEAAVQSAFREVADGLARQGTIIGQRRAQERLVASAAHAYALAEAQYRAGTDTFVNALVAQRTLYSVRQGQVGVVQADVSNRISLYQALGADASLAS